MDKALRKNVGDLIKTARKAGATQAKTIDISDLIVDRRVRLKCMIPVCNYYKRHLLCPPNLMSVDEFAETLKGYEKALILQVESDFDAADKLNMPLTEEAYRNLEKETRVSEYELKLHRIVNQLETEAFKRGYYFATGLIAGSCKLCTECVGQGGVCKHPFEARPSMEAMSIDVVETCKRACLPLELSSDRKVRWTGLVLLY